MRTPTETPTRRPRLRHRPVGEPARLPRDLSGFAKWWIGVAVLLAVGYVGARATGRLGELQRTLDASVSDLLRDQTGGALGRAGRAIDRALPWALLLALRWSIVVALVVFKRWRHLAVFVATVAIVTAVARWFPTAGVVGTGVAGQPSEAVAGVAVTMLGAVYGLAPGGRARRLSLIATAIALAVLSVELIVTSENTVSEVAIGSAIGVSISFIAYRFFTPEAVFPVSYGFRRTAHLELTAARSASIRGALERQLGLDVAEVEPFGTAASRGSTPLRITIADGTKLFGKLYATNHLRADRWYKLGRTVLYGALEDESPSTRSDGWSSTRTTCSATSGTTGSPRPTHSDSQRSRPNANTSWCAGSSTVPPS